MKLVFFIEFLCLHLLYQTLIIKKIKAYEIEKLIINIRQSDN